MVGVEVHMSFVDLQFIYSIDINFLLECTPANSCEWARQKAKKGLHNELVHCSFQGRTSVICCPLEVAKRKSEKYCDLIKNLDKYDEKYDSVLKISFIR